MKNRVISLSILFLLILFFILHLFYGNFDVINCFLTKCSLPTEKWIILNEIRLPRTIITIFAGSGLAVSGLLLQTFFNNELAGPSVLGISSGASLFISLSVFSGFTFFQYNSSLFVSSLIGSSIVCIILILFSTYLKNKISLLLIGMMLGSFINSFIQMLEIKSTELNLKLFTFWGLGSLQHFELSSFPLILIIFIICALLSFYLIKPLNLLLLGENELILNAYSIVRIKWLIILTSSALTAIITAYCGPIAFIGLAVPNICRIILRTSSHRILLIYTALIGSIFLLICDYIILLTEDYFLIPINAITSLLGAPIIIWIIIKKW